MKRNQEKNNHIMEEVITLIFCINLLSQRIQNGPDQKSLPQDILITTMKGGSNTHKIASLKIFTIEKYDN